MPGPLPNRDSIRRNAPTIPTTRLPVSGRKDPPPTPPTWMVLGEHGLAWWQWAWTTPEACGWSGSLVDIAAQRAMLVDDLAALDHVDSLDQAEIFDALLDEARDRLKDLFRRLAGLAGGRIQVVRAMGLLDVQLGLGAKNLAALRWEIYDDSTDPEADDPDLEPEVDEGSSRSRFEVFTGGKAAG